MQPGWAFRPERPAKPRFREQLQPAKPRFREQLRPATFLAPQVASRPELGREQPATSRWAERRLVEQGWLQPALA
jgi:hypothetical protein